MNQRTTNVGLARVLGPITATAIVVGTIIGSGVFKKPQAIAEVLPYSGVVALVWIVGGLLTLTGALAYAEVAVVLPRVGGNYVFLREAYGRLAGFLWGWVDFWIIRSASIAALATIFTESLHAIFTNDLIQSALGMEQVRVADWAQRAITVTLILGLALVNILGVRLGGGLQVVVTLVKVLTLLGIAMLPLVLLGLDTGPTSHRPSTANLAPVWPTTWDALSFSALATATLSVLWPYHGWMNIAPIAGEVREPQRNLPLALLLGVCLVILIYLGCNLAYYLTMPGTEIQTMKDRPVATEFALRLLGPIGAALASAVVMISVFGSLNGNILVGPRLLYAMGEDGLAPRWLHSVAPTLGTPAAAIAVLATWAALLVSGEFILSSLGVLASLKSPFDTLTDFAMFGAVIFETLAVVSIFRLRVLMPDAPRPYRCPGYPVLPALYVLVPAAVLINMFFKQRVEAFTGIGIILTGVLFYYGLRLNRR